MNVYEIEEHGHIFTCSNEPVDSRLISSYIFTFLDELCCDYYEYDHCTGHSGTDYDCNVIVIIINTSVFQICFCRELLGDKPKYYYNCFTNLIVTPDSEIKNYFETDIIPQSYRRCLIYNQ